MSERSFLVFQFGGTLGALPLEGIERIVPMAELARPPGLPPALEGILNLGGRPVPVIRLDRLLQLPESRPGLYSMLLLPKSEARSQVAMMVDRVTEILRVAEREVLPVSNENSFHTCVEASIRTFERVVHLLSFDRILLAREQDALAAFLEMERVRLLNWGTTIQ